MDSMWNLYICTLYAVFNLIVGIAMKMYSFQKSIRLEKQHFKNQSAKYQLQLTIYLSN